MNISKDFIPDLYKRYGIVIQKMASEQGISKYKLGELSGVPQRSVDALMMAGEKGCDPGRYPTIESLEAMMNVLGSDFRTLTDRAYDMLENEPDLDYYINDTTIVVRDIKEVSLAKDVNRVARDLILANAVRNRVNDENNKKTGTNE